MYDHDQSDSSFEAGDVDASDDEEWLDDEGTPIDEGMVREADVKVISTRHKFYIPKFNKLSILYFHSPSCLLLKKWNAVGIQS